MAAVIWTVRRKFAVEIPRYHDLLPRRLCRRRGKIGAVTFKYIDLTSV